MQILATITQALSSQGLIVLVLVHSGNGGGLRDMFGGGLGSAAAGSPATEYDLDRITVVLAVAFTFNTLILAFIMNT